MEEEQEKKVFVQVEESEYNLMVTLLSKMEEVLEENASFKKVEVKNVNDDINLNNLNNLISGGISNFWGTSKQP